MDSSADKGSSRNTIRSYPTWQGVLHSASEQWGLGVASDVGVRLGGHSTITCGAGAQLGHWDTWDTEKIVAVPHFCGRIIASSHLP